MHYVGAFVVGGNSWVAEKHVAGDAHGWYTSAWQWRVPAVEANVGQNRRFLAESTWWTVQATWIWSAFNSI